MVTVPGQVDDRAAVREQDVTVSGSGGNIDAYLARPLDAAGPGILLIHEAFGLNEHIRDLARRFAKAGYHVLAPNLYARSGAPDPGNMGDVMKKMFALPDRDAVDDMEACITYLRNSLVGEKKVGCIGFCSGARHTLLLASHSAPLNAAISCWPGFTHRATQDSESTSQRPTPIIKLAKKIRCPILLAGGADDTNPAPDELQALKDVLDKANVEAEVHIYPDAGHAFLADYRPSYREDPAFALWADILRFFDKHLRGRSGQAA